MVPIVEIRGAVPVAVANDLNLFWTYVICILGNMLLGYRAKLGVAFATLLVIRIDNIFLYHGIADECSGKAHKRQR